MSSDICIRKAWFQGKPRVDIQRRHPVVLGLNRHIIVNPEKFQFFYFFPLSFVICLFYFIFLFFCHCVPFLGSLQKPQHLHFSNLLIPRFFYTLLLWTLFNPDFYDVDSTANGARSSKIHLWIYFIAFQDITGVWSWIFMCKLYNNNHIFIFYSPWRSFFSSLFCNFQFTLTNLKRMNDWINK